MIFNNIFADTLILSIPIILFGIYNVIKGQKKYNNQPKYLFYSIIMFIIFPILTALLSVSLYEKAPRLGITIYLLLIVIAICNLIYSLISKKIPFKYSIPLVILSVLYPILVPIVGFPVWLLTIDYKSNYNPPITRADTKVIEKNLSNIKERFIDIDKLIKEETKNIDSIYSIIYENIEEKNISLQKLNNELYETKKELAIYKNLANVSKKEAQSIKNIIESNKYIDYLVGLLSGIVSSLFVAFTIKYFQKRSI